MNNVAYQADEFYEPQERGATSADKYLLTDRKFGRRTPSSVTIETGIEELGKIEIRSGKAPSEVLLEQLEQVVTRLRQIQSLGPGWDSYGAPRVRSTAFGPATKIVLGAISRCVPPRLEANSGGGIDIIWEEEGRSLTLSAFSDDVFEALLTEDDEIVAPDEHIGFAQAQQFLEQFCANR